jgi:beta-N-acetylhexosaminidase
VEDRGDAVLGRLMLAFRGMSMPSRLRDRLASAPAAGVTLFRRHNVRSPAQVAALTADLQEAARVGARSHVDSELLPLLIAADQEGGQLLALGDGWTPFAGSMAIGATRDANLAERVGRAIGLELRAVGVNVNYGPVLDVVASRENPTVGIRAFSDDPALVARLGSAWVRGLQSAGVAATGKHFPGLGRVTADTHHALGIVETSRADLDAVELPPYRAAIEAGMKMVMTGHFANPALTGSASLPATLAAPVLGRLLRDELGFEGVVITDALDMRALPQDASQAIDVVAALQAGVDLLLTTADRRARDRIETAVRRAAEVQLLDPAGMAASEARIAALRRWIGSMAVPPLDVVGSPEHRALARELAERSLTLVRDDAEVLPLRLEPDATLLAVMPEPRDLTPADTSSFVAPQLADALRAHHPRVEEVVITEPTTQIQIAGTMARAQDAAAVVVGTIGATAGSIQVDLVEALLAAGRPVVTVAMRTPWDALAYPSARTNVATYSILRPSLDALAAAIFGRTEPRDAFPGRLPVALS